jgi:hypothetical protein
MRLLEARSETITFKESNELRLLQEIKEKSSYFTTLPPRATCEMPWHCNCQQCCISALDRGPEFAAVGRLLDEPDSDLVFHPHETGCSSRELQAVTPLTKDIQAFVGQ